MDQPEKLQLLEPRQLLFLCYGNICRSPFVEHYFRQRSNGVACRSAGFIESLGRTTPPDYRRLALEHGVDLRDHGSNWASPELMAWADAVVLMDDMNMSDLRRLYPEAEERTFRLGAFLEPPCDEIEDPYHLGHTAAREVYQQMAEATDNLLALLD